MHNSALQQKISQFESPEDDEDFQDFERKQMPKQSKMALRSQTQINKKPSVSFNLGRIIPKNIVHDKEQLYSDNIRLREEITQTKDANTKLKTRVAFLEKEKNQILGNILPPDIGIRRESSRSAPRNGHKISSGSIQSQNFMKRMLRESKDECEKLKKQNNKLKKTIKYTKIQQLLVQNAQYNEECSRLADLLSSDNFANQNMHHRIDQLKNQLVFEKETSKSLLAQIKRKNQEVQKVRRQAKESQENVKKITKEYNALRMERRTDRGINYTNSIKEGVINRKSPTIEGCNKCNDKDKQLKKNIGQKEELSKTIIELRQILKQKDQELRRLKQKKDEFEEKEENKERSMPKQQKEIKNNSEKKENNLYKQQKDDKQNVKNSSEKKEHQEEVKKKEKEQKQVEQKKLTEQYQSDQYDINDDEFQNQQFTPIQSTSKGQEKQEKQKEENVPKNQQQGQKEEDEAQEYNFDDDYEEEKLLGEDEERILRETLSYRFYAQRYTLYDLQSDLKQSEIEKITAEELLNMLGTEPFVLNEELMQTIMGYLFEKQQITDKDYLFSKDFVNKFKLLIQSYPLLAQDEERKQLQKIKEFFEKPSKYKKISESFNKKAGGEKNINQEKFRQVLKEQTKFNEEQVRLCIGEATLVSGDIDHLNYAGFMERIKAGEE